jgi:DNA (cytosine-5)-methyltransferase 1/site-specific DNA-methyltransferase (adenine-specific)
LSFVIELQPEVFVIENVKTLLSTSNGWFRKEIVNTIKELGYYVNYGILNASHFGVPQARERAIFICSKQKEVCLPVGYNNSLVTVRDAIFDLAYLNSSEGEFVQDYKFPAQSEYQKVMRANSLKLYNHIASKHKQIAIEKLRMIPPEKGKEFLPSEMIGNQKFKTTWGRLKWDTVSPTIDTRFDAASNGTNNHPFLHRAITPREAARIQSFDDNFVFIGSKVRIRKQIGNAVPPLMAKAIADQIFDTLNN